MSLRMQHLMMYKITQVLRNQMSHPLFIVTYHHHLNLNMLKTLVMLFQVIRLHRCNILPNTHVENLSLAKFLISNLICKRLRRFTQLKHTKSLLLLHPQKNC